MSHDRSSLNGDRDRRIRSLATLLWALSGHYGGIVAATVQSSGAGVVANRLRQAHPYGQEEGS